MVRLKLTSILWIVSRLSCSADEFHDQSIQSQQASSQFKQTTPAQTIKSTIIVKKQTTISEKLELVDFCERCIQEFHQHEKKTLLQAENNKTLQNCIIKAIVDNENPENSELKNCLKTKSWSECISTPTSSVQVSKVELPTWQKLIAKDHGKQCLMIGKQLKQNRSVIMDIVAKGDETKWNCVSDLLRKNPESQVTAGIFSKQTKLSAQVESTADCIERSADWNHREDTMMFLGLNTDDLTKKLLKLMTAGIFMVLQFTMLGLGCEIKISEVKKHAKKPYGAIIAVSAQFGVMPLAAFVISRALDLDFYPSIALIICGCCPGGNLSNMLAYAVRGDMNLSILMTTCSSIGGLIAMPILTFVYGTWTKEIFKKKMLAEHLENAINGTDASDFDFQLEIPYATIIFNLLFTLIPCGIGIYIANKQEQWVRITQKIAGGLMMTTTVLTICDIIYIFGWDLAAKFEPKVIVACGLLPLVGYVVGYTVSRIFGQKRNLSRTIAIETGCQNVQLCGVILRTGFLWCDIGIYFLITLIYIGFQIGWAMIAVIMVRYKEVKLTNQKKKGFHGELTIEQIQDDFGRQPNVIECDVCEHREAEVEGLLSKDVNESESSKC